MKSRTNTDRREGRNIPGYSWVQIIHKAFDARQESGELKEQPSSRPLIVYNYYNRVKREKQMRDEEL